MKFDVRVKQLRTGQWQARYIGGKVETLDLIADSKEAVIERMRDNIRYHRNVNLGIAVALDWGLIVPVIKNADQLNVVGLAKTANDLADRARTKKLKPEEASGGTFTITNPGVFGSLFGTPVINQPQVAILGVGVVEKRPVVVTDADGNDTIAIKTMCYFGISYDHRLVDGEQAVTFLVRVKERLEDPARLVLNV